MDHITPEDRLGMEVTPPRSAHMLGEKETARVGLHRLETATTILFGLTKHPLLERDGALKLAVDNVRAAHRIFKALHEPHDG